MLTACSDPRNLPAHDSPDTHPDTSERVEIIARNLGLDPYWLEELRPLESLWAYLPGDPQGIAVTSPSGCGAIGAVPRIALVNPAAGIALALGHLRG